MPTRPPRTTRHVTDARRGVLYGGAFLLWAALVASRVLAAFDLQATRLLQQWGTAWLDWMLFAFTLIGSVESTGAIVCGLGLWQWARGERRVAAGLWAAFIVMTLLEAACKLWLPQPHVPAAYDRNPWGAIGFIHVRLPYAFPSGHTLRSVFLFGYLDAWLTRGEPRQAWRLTSHTCCVALILLVCVSRIYLGDHWASDVIGGALLACAGLAWVGHATRACVRG